MADQVPLPVALPDHWYKMAIGVSAVLMTRCAKPTPCGMKVQRGSDPFSRHPKVIA